MATAVDKDAAPNTEWSAKGTWRSQTVDAQERRARFESHLAQVRSTREQLLRRNADTTSTVPPTGLLHLLRLHYCPKEWPLRETLMQVLGLLPTDDLSSLHKTVPGLENRAASGLKPKLKLLAPLAQPSACAPFHDLYTSFILRHIAPILHNKLGETRLLFQAFPCVRVSQPCEFPTIRPHVDQAYGHPRGSINAWLPLTCAQGSNTLQIETAPGKEDFQPVEGDYTEGVFGDMNQCTHFTVPNTTDSTRVSLDFRLVPWSYWSSQDTEGMPYKIGQYYSLCELTGDEWRLVPDACGYACKQHGIPHVRM